MAILRINTAIETSSLRQSVVLEGRSYDLAFRWSQREDAWYLSIGADGATLLAGVKLIADWPLLRLQTSELLPPGELYALDSTGAGQDPGLRDLSSGRTKLLYIESEETS